METAEATGAIGSVDLLDRDSEVVRLDRALEGLARHHGAVVVVEGPAGIGKTRLLEQLVERAREMSVRLLHARAGELEQDVPFGVVRQLFDPLVADGGRSGLLEGAAGLAAPVFREVGTTVVEDPSFSILHGLHWLTVNAAGGDPLVLALDDAHWADDPSLRFLVYLANRIADLPVLVVATSRPFEPGAEVELVDRLASHPRTDLLRPRPLGRDAVGRLVGAYLETPADPDLVDSCLRATGGNPLFVREVLRELAGSGRPDASGDLARLLERSPQTLARAIARRLARLPHDALALARAASVLDGRAELPVLGELAGLDGDAAGRAADVLVGAEIFRPSLEFQHPVVRSALYAQMPALQRSALHRRAAELASREAAEPGRVARHLAAAGPQGDAHTVHVLRQAAKEASARGAPDIAARFLARALAEPPPAPVRAEVLIELGLVEIAARGIGGFTHMREALRVAPTARQRAEVALAFSKPLVAYGHLDDAAEVLRRALDELPGDDRELRHKIEGALMHASLGDLATLEPLGGLAALADRIAQDDPIADPLRLAALGVITVSAVPPASRGADMAVRALSDGRVSLTDEPGVFAAVTIALAAADRLEEARAIADTAVADARRGGSVNSVAFACSLRARILMRAGDVRGAEADARENLRLLGEHAWMGDELRASVPWALAPLIEALVERGRLEEASRILAQARLEDEPPQLAQYAFLLLSVGRLRLAEGRRDDAIAALREGARRFEAWGASSPGLGTWRTHLGLALAGGGAREEGLELVERDLAAACRFELPCEEGMALRAKALVVRGDAGIALLRDAVDVLGESPARLEYARASADLGAALRRAGSRVAARDPLRVALDLAQTLGADALAARAHTELLQSGARPRNLALTGPASLTASEARVAAMASEGLTNREVAEALFLAEKTVEGHLSNVYRKLSITARTQLRAALEASGTAAA